MRRLRDIPRAPVELVWRLRRYRWIRPLLAELAEESLPAEIVGWECEGFVYLVTLLVLCCGMRFRVAVGQHCITVSVKFVAVESSGEIE